MKKIYKHPTYDVRVPAAKGEGYPGFYEDKDVNNLKRNIGSLHYDINEVHDEIIKLQDMVLLLDDTVDKLIERLNKIENRLEESSFGSDFNERQTPVSSMPTPELTGTNAY